LKKAGGALIICASSFRRRRQVLDLLASWTWRRAAVARPE